MFGLGGAEKGLLPASHPFQSRMPQDGTLFLADCDGQHRGGRGQPRRPPPAGRQPGRERRPPHAARASTVAVTRRAATTARRCSRSPTTAPGSPRRSAIRSSPASSAAAAPPTWPPTPAPASAWRSSRRSPPPTAAGRGRARGRRRGPVHRRLPLGRSRLAAARLAAESLAPLYKPLIRFGPDETPPAEATPDIASSGINWPVLSLSQSARRALPLPEARRAIFSAAAVRASRSAAAGCLQNLRSIISASIAAAWAPA